MNVVGVNDTGAVDAGSTLSVTPLTVRVCYQMIQIMVKPLLV